MKRVNIFISIIILTISFFCLNWIHLSPVYCAEEYNITQREFITHLVKVMSLKMPENAQINDYIKALESRGITIPGGYKPDELITSKQMAIMLIPAMSLDKEKFERTKEQISLSYKDKAVIINIVGDVKIKQKGLNEWGPAELGKELNIEDIIKTGNDSSAIIRLGQITVTKIKENTIAAVYQLAKEPIIYMETGDIILDTSGSPHAYNHYVITPTTVAAVRGTIIEVIYKQESPTVQGATSVIVAQGKTGVYNVSQYTLTEKITMARENEFPVKGLEVSEGNYIIKDKMYPLSEEQNKSIYSETENMKLAAETNLLGTAAEKTLKEKGITDKDYLKIDIIDSKINKRNLAKADK